MFFLYCPQLLLALASIALPSLAEDSKPIDKCVAGRVREVELNILKSNPPKLAVVVAVDMPAPSRFFGPLELLRVDYPQPPADGIQDFVLITARQEFGLAVEPKIKMREVSAIIDAYESKLPWMKGVRIIGGEGQSVVKMLAKK